LTMVLQAVEVITSANN